MTLFKAFLIIALFHLPIILAQQDCRKFITDTLNQKQRPGATPRTQEQTWYFELSGTRGRLDLGQRAKCEEIPSMRYFVLIRTKNFDKSTVYAQEESGICLPAFCTKEIIRNDHSILQDLFSLNNFYSGLPNIGLYDIHEAPPKTTGFYAFAGFITGLTLLSLISTLIIFIKKRLSHGPLPRSFWLFKSFDLVENVKGLYATAAEAGQSDQTSTFGFLRFFAAVWIIYYHTQTVNGGNHKRERPSAYPLIEYFIWSGQFAVGYFFFIGGFVASFSLASKVTRQTMGIVQYIKLIFHRWLRMYPAIVISLMLMWCGVPYVLNGPFWGRYLSLINAYNEEAWQNLMLVNNLHKHPLRHCGAWTWYVNVDLHAYFVVVLTVFLYTWKKFLGYIISIGIIFYSVYMRATFDYFHTIDRSFEIFYGIIFGLHYYEYFKLKYRCNFFYLCEKVRLLRYIFVLFGLYLNYAALYYNAKELNITEARWNYVKRSLFSLATAFVFLPVANSKPSHIKVFFNLRTFQVLGKLSFGLYLFHRPLVDAFILMEDQIPEFYDFWYLIDLCKRVFLWTLVMAFVFHLIYERPLLNIEAHFTKRSSREMAVDQEKEVVKNGEQQSGQGKEIEMADNSSFDPLAKGSKGQNGGYIEIDASEDYSGKDLEEEGAAEMEKGVSSNN